MAQFYRNEVKEKPSIFQRVFGLLANPLTKSRTNSWPENTNDKEKIKDEINEEVYKANSMMSEVSILKLYQMIIRSKLTSRIKLKNYPMPELKLVNASRKNVKRLKQELTIRRRDGPLIKLAFSSVQH